MSAPFELIVHMSDAAIVDDEDYAKFAANLTVGAPTYSSRIYSNPTVIAVDARASTVTLP